MSTDPAAAGAAPAGPPPANNLVWGILTTVLCCLPFGIVSIVYAAKVDGLWASGHPDAAHRHAKLARTWAIVAAAVTGVLVVGWVMLAVVGAALS